MSTGAAPTAPPLPRTTTADLFRDLTAGKLDAGMSRCPLLWLNAYVTDMRAVYRDDFWPYGCEANRATIQAFLDHTGAEAVTSRPLSPNDLFETY